MKNLYNHIYKNKLSIFLVLIFLATITQQYLFKGNHVLLIYGFKNLISFNNLNNDWVTNFTNHVPLYTYLTFILSKFFSIKSIYILYYLLLFICTFSLFKILDQNYKFNQREVILWFLFFLIFFHENSYFVGVAGQSVINETLQPSTFGIFFFLSIFCFLNSKITLSVIAICIAVYFHPTYLIHSIFFILGYLICKLINKNYLSFFKIGIIYFILIIPVVYFLYSNFIIEDPTINFSAQKILVEDRIPHHAKISQWFTYKDFISIVIIGIGLYLIRDKKSFFIPLLVVFVLSFSLTLIQYFTNNYFIALLFPWRSSVFLMPITSLVIISYFVKKINLNLKFITILFLVVFSVFFLKNIFIEERFNKKLDDKKDLFIFLNDTKKIDLLLTPIYIEDIRMNTSIPIFVNWKFHAFKNNEIVDWYERVNIVKKFYRASNLEIQSKLLNEINLIQKTSHILIEKGRQKDLLIKCEIINSSKNYVLYDSNSCFKK